MTYNLFIDDIRNPDWRECVLSGVDPDLEWVIVRNSLEAIDYVSKHGMPERMALDHDLGYVNDRFDTVPNFLKWLANEYWNGTDPVPDYTIHSANPIGVENMRSFMDSWKKSTEE